MLVTATYDLSRSVDHEPYVTVNSIMLVCLPFINYFSNFIHLKFSHIYSLNNCGHHHTYLRMMMTAIIQRVNMLGI